MKHLVFSRRTLVITLAAGLSLAVADFAVAQKKPRVQSREVYGPKVPKRTYPDSYSSTLNGQVEAYEIQKFNDQKKARRRSNYFKRFIDHDLSGINNDGTGY